MEIVAPDESEAIRRWRWSSQSGIVSGILGGWNLNTITLTRNRSISDADDECYV
jgi:hypothetical protein